MGTDVSSVEPEHPIAVSILRPLPDRTLTWLSPLDVSEEAPSIFERQVPCPPPFLFNVLRPYPAQGLCSRGTRLRTFPRFAS